MVMNGAPRSLADLVPGSPPKVEVEEVKLEKGKSRKKTPAQTTSPADDAADYVDGIYIFNSENDLNHTERDFYLKRRRKYLEEYSLNDSADMGLIHRIIMEEILGERIYTEMLKNPGNPILGQQLTESNKRYQTALDTLGASRDKRIRNRESGGISVADLAKTYFDERKNVFAVDKQKKDLEDQALDEQQQKFFELEFGQVEQGGFWKSDDGYTDDEE